MIQKIDGCNHVICRCRFQFCFVCKTRWNNSHYGCREGAPIDQSPNRFFQRGTGFNICDLNCLQIFCILLFLPIILVWMLTVGVFLFLTLGLVYTCRMISERWYLIFVFPFVFIIGGAIGVKQFIGC